MVFAGVLGCSACRDASTSGRGTEYDAPALSLIEDKRREQMAAVIVNIIIIDLELSHSKRVAHFDSTAVLSLRLIYRGHYEHTRAISALNMRHMYVVCWKEQEQPPAVRGQAAGKCLRSLEPS